MELDGTVLGKFGKAGKQLKEFTTVHAMDCRNETRFWSPKSPAGACRNSPCARKKRKSRPGEAGHANAIDEMPGGFYEVCAPFSCCVPDIPRRRAIVPRLLAQSIPEISYDSVPNFLKMPDDIYLGEVLGVSTNSKGHIFVYTRSGSDNVTTGTNRDFCALRLAPF